MLRRPWQVAAAVIPLSIFFGEVLRGTLGSNDALHWTLVVNPLLLVLITQLFLLRVIRGVWLVPWKVPQHPTAAQAQRVLTRAVRYLKLAWGVSASQALMGLFLLLVAAPRLYAYFFMGVALVYLLIFYPRPTFFANLLPEEEGEQKS